ncbi:hypothetical protein C0991_011883 [Blastosporella zonata]|nr:hypothetical protein C0991_011883 [Blastosporella zonata]
MVQQVFASVNTGGNNNSTSPSLNATSISNDISSIIALFYSYSALRDWLKLIIIGGIFESLRRLIMTCYTKFLDSFFIRASFDNDDQSYEWILVWLSKQPSWSKTRDMQITTSSSGGNSSAVVLEGEEDYSRSMFSKSSRKISYLPSTSLTYSLWFKRRWMTIRRMQQQSSPMYGYFGEKENTLHISILTRDHNILTDLLQEARRLYMADQEHSMCIYVSDNENNWNHVACRARRSLNSIVLDPGVKDVLLEDARDFLQSKSWYAERGIPFRRGYLLYGAPGTGKTSMIHCMAGELRLDVYIISLSRSGLDDASLSKLVNALPERCVALMEDIDAAFTHGVSRSGTSENNDELKKSNSGQPAAPGTMPTPSRLSLSGLLNALDGVGAQEGRILFATTNRYSALDPALCRPGRMDLHVEFKNASKYQARELFDRFYLPNPPKEGAADALASQQVGKAAKPKPGDGNLGLQNEKQLVDDAESSESRKASSGNIELITGQTHTGRAPKLSHPRIAELAERFADAIPDRECSMAGLQGYLMSYKTRPVEAADGAVAWVEKERQEKKDRDKEAKEKKEKEKEKKTKETEKEVPVSAPVPAPAPPPCSCRRVPTCVTCGGAKVEDVVVTSPSPISKPASPIPVPTSQLLAPDDNTNSPPLQTSG